jgi:hypothetical protein
MDMSSDTFDAYARAEAVREGYNMSKDELEWHVLGRRLERDAQREDRHVRLLAHGLSPQARAELGRAIGWAPVQQIVRQEVEKQWKHMQQGDDSLTCPTHGNRPHHTWHDKNDTKVYIDGVDDLVAMQRNGSLWRLRLSPVIKKEVAASLRALSTGLPLPVHPLSRAAEEFRAGRKVPTVRSETRGDEGRGGTDREGHERLEQRGAGQGAAVLPRKSGERGGMGSPETRSSRSVGEGLGEKDGGRLETDKGGEGRKVKERKTKRKETPKRLGTEIDEKRKMRRGVDAGVVGVGADVEVPEEVDDVTRLRMLRGLEGKQDGTDSDKKRREERAGRKGVRGQGIENERDERSERRHRLEAKGFHPASLEPQVRGRESAAPSTGAADSSSRGDREGRVGEEKEVLASSMSEEELECMVEQLAREGRRVISRGGS